MALQKSKTRVFRTIGKSKSRNNELKHNKPHLVVQLESLVGMIMEITTISWDMTLKKMWLYSESTTGTGTFPGFHFRLALLVPLGMRFLAEKLMFSRTVSFDATRQGRGMGYTILRSHSPQLVDIRYDLGKGMKGTMVNGC
jgi:hypothetical protein